MTVESTKMQVEIVRAHYDDPVHARAVIGLLDAYANDPFGGAEPLAAQVKQNLVAALSQRVGAFSVLAFVDGVAVGLANCFEGFSTFRCAPLINIHDLMVMPAFRGQGIAQRMMSAVEAVAQERGCCKITLEVLEGNHHAQRVYAKMQYAAYQLSAEHGNALMWQKKLS